MQGNQTRKYEETAIVPTLAGQNGRMDITVRENYGLMSGIRSRDGRYVGQGVAQELARTYFADSFAHELLCADPSPIKIPDLISYLSSEFPRASSPSTAPKSLRSEFMERVG